MSNPSAEPAPLALSTVLSPEWLSSALSMGRSERVEVVTVEQVETLKTVATKVRFAVTYRNPPALPLPHGFCVKGYFDPEGPSRLSAGLTETLFYRDVAATLDVRLPPCFYTGVDERTGHAIFIMEDLTAAGSTFLTALSAYTPAQARMTLDQLARLHASNWSNPKLAETPWLGSKIDSLLTHVDADTLQHQLDGPRGEPLPAEVKDARRLRNGLVAVLAAGAEEPECLIHGDAHAGNVFETTGGPGLIDWQLAQRGSWALDVAYHIAAVLDVEERRRSEADLLVHYLARLASYGVDAPSWDEAWLRYRAGLTYGYYLWGITHIVEAPVIMEFVRRLGSAVADHDSFALLGV